MYPPEQEHTGIRVHISCQPNFTFQRTRSINLSLHNCGRERHVNKMSHNSRITRPTGRYDEDWKFQSQIQDRNGIKSASRKSYQSIRAA
ncbi:hypothetical protein EUGRSUZ_J02416 [Eucalyptus grandis]|uniref:Uncharacterized protein n=2 Tax=Eucalyptus grandis TaxID=71139 RepID=A0ACC3J8X2_EUCGR|nr:hypothetical protein EUGRSUZ_J02416 [Eucalyptus grandis]